MTTRRARSDDKAAKHPGLYVRVLAAGLLIFTVIGGCSKPPESEPVARPVRVVRLGERVTGSPMSYAGEVKARYETKLSFRVAGKVVARHIEVGDRVRKGQLLAQLDPTDYQLTANSVASQLAAARAERDFAQDDLARYRELREQNFISPAEFDRHATVYTTARDRVEALAYQLKQANDQSAYTSLYADRDGAITALEVEAGQVVTAGQPVVLLAQIDEKEVVIHVPEHRVGEIHSTAETAIALWADVGRRFKGRVREVAPSADPASRTYSVKITLLEGQDAAKLGMTATVYFPVSTIHPVTVPLAAAFEGQSQPGQSRVWLVDVTTKTVKSQPVSLGAPLGGERLVVAGLNEGQIVVSAGVNRLVEGQTVRILGEDTGQAHWGTVANRLGTPAPSELGALQ